MLLIQRRCLAINRRWSSPSRLPLAYQQDFTFHAAEPRQRSCLDNGEGGVCGAWCGSVNNHQSRSTEGM